MRDVSPIAVYAFISCSFIGSALSRPCTGRGGVCTDQQAGAGEASASGLAGQLTGFGSVPVDFYGYEGQVYNLLTEKQHHVNAAFLSLGGNALVVNRIAIQYAVNGVSCFVQAVVGEPGRLANGLLHLEVNGQMLDTFTKISDESMLLTVTTQYDVKITYQREAGGMEILKVSTPVFKFYIRKPGGELHFLLDIAAKKDAPPSMTVHGILGQTFACSKLAPGRRQILGCGKLLLDESDYRVSHMYGLDFKYDLFKPSG